MDSSVQWANGLINWATPSPQGRPMSQSDFRSWTRTLKLVRFSYPCNAEHCYRQQKVWFSTWMLPLLEGPCFWQSYHKLQGHCQGFSINRSWCALHASLMVGSFLLHAAISGGRDGPMLQGCHPRCHHHFGGLFSLSPVTA